MKYIALVALLLSGCASVGETVLGAGTSGAARFDPTDVEAAIKIAQDTKDPVAEACFKAIRAHTDKSPAPEVKGIVSAYAAARAAAHAAQAGLAEDVHVACAPLVVDAAQFNLKLGKVFAESAALGLLKPPIPLQVLK